MADGRGHDDVAHAVDDAGVHQHEPISLEVDARFGAQLDHRGDLPRERPAERAAESEGELLMRRVARDSVLLSALSLLIRL